ncbi:hypothetical protein F8388_010118 [Cannabis sativa]|uniref:Uncharacterized protein n=1 Tax=Cannabis sativa TaxID=3483 RepID=A0A7J6G1Q5_CANSA|nr:hypothetical protein G4B88_029344 [Cannabis sativa]KAF4385562.1 hypothetical protein F8388_010118 [Cannabis sativa]
MFDFFFFFPIPIPSSKSTPSLVLLTDTKNSKLNKGYKYELTLMFAPADPKP